MLRCLYLGVELKDVLSYLIRVVDRDLPGRQRDAALGVLTPVPQLCLVFICESIRSSFVASHHRVPSYLEELTSSVGTHHLATVEAAVRRRIEVVRLDASVPFLLL